MSQLEKKIVVKGKIKTLTGLHIGGSNQTIQIGGIDSSVVRNPITNRPYIPGSSLKGKIRSLLEINEGKFGPGLGSEVKQGPTVDHNLEIVKLFGNAEKNGTIPSKIIFRDCDIYDPDDKILNNTHTDLPYTEAKTEIVVDRITAKATPRQIERVPAGVEFTFEVVINVFNNDEGNRHLDLLIKGMKLLENDYLGGKGSRGSGQIKFKIEEVFYTDNQVNLVKDDNLLKKFSW